MSTLRSAWIRGLRLYRASTPAGVYDPGAEDDAVDERICARSRFRSVRHRERYAVYSLHERGAETSTEPMAPGDHTLAVVREFRRVPLHAAALGLVLFVARAGREAQVVATLAHFAERALSFYQPPYLLLARSLEQPGITALLAGVQPSMALEAAGATAFSVDQLMPEVGPLLAADPEWYAYCHDRDLDCEPALVSPYAV